MRRALLVLLPLALLAGCLDAEAVCAPGAAGRAYVTPLVSARHMETDPSQPWQTVVLGPVGDGGSKAYTAAPDGWGAHALPLSAAGAERTFEAVTVATGAGVGTLGLDYALPPSAPGCDDGVAGTLSWDLAAPRAGTGAQPGQGVHVMTAGFWENGTLFYTNIAEVDADPRWPRAGWYAWEGGEPLPVYVYDEARSEQPAAWTDPQAGTPLAGTVPGVGYFTTIPGFNEALQGLSPRTTRVVHLAPEDAYTRPGNEEHDLYGDALVFYIKVLEVVDLPCPAWVDAPCAVQPLPVPAAPARLQGPAPRPRPRPPLPPAPATVK